MLNHSKSIADTLLIHYDQFARQLPWRSSRDPYHIWLSEIMLQQTQVSTVISYYNRFIDRLPNVAALAKVGDDELLKLWEGLGYYSRAKNLKKAAILIQTKWHGNVPNCFEDLMTLPGIGPYSAGAIASIAFNQQVPAIDGNVFRVVSRLFLMDTVVNSPKARAIFTPIVMSLIPKDRPGDFNQALMDLGSEICLANQAPKCPLCPIAFGCLAFKENKTMLFPKKLAKKERKVEDHTILLFLCKQNIYIEKRASKGLLSNMWEFINLDDMLSLEQVNHFCHSHGYSQTNITCLGKCHHLFTHLRWNMIGYLIEVDSEKMIGKGSWTSIDRLATELAMPTALKSYKNQLLKQRYIQEAI